MNSSESSEEWISRSLSSSRDLNSSEKNGHLASATESRETTGAEPLFSKQEQPVQVSCHLENNDLNVTFYLPNILSAFESN